MTKFSHIQIAAACLAIPILAACASHPYVPTIYDAATANVQTIALADDALPEKMGANELASYVGTGQAAGGLIGLLVVSAMEGAETVSRVSKLNTLMDTIDFDAETEFETILTAKLAETGYGNVQIIGGERQGNRPLTEKTLPETNADAVLDVSMVTFGMQKAKTGEQWRPMAGVKIQLLAAQTSEILMENMISYNSGKLGAGTRNGYIVMEPDLDTTGYFKIKDMNPEIVRDETINMLEEISEMIVTLL